MPGGVLGAMQAETGSLLSARRAQGVRLQTSFQQLPKSLVNNQLQLLQEGMALKDQARRLGMAAPCLEASPTPPKGLDPGAETQWREGAKGTRHPAPASARRWGASSPLATLPGLLPRPQPLLGATPWARSSIGIGLWNPQQS